jgi:hypothetical protein
LDDWQRALKQIQPDESQKKGRLAAPDLDNKSSDARQKISELFSRARLKENFYKPTA